jgi:hypothetical protein
LAHRSSSAVRSAERPLCRRDRFRRCRQLWCLQNEDANPNLVVINLASGRQVRLTFPPPPHGGGYDDLVVLNDQVFITASNPKLDANGVNEFPALLRITLQNGQIHLDTVLKGNAQATDIPTGNTVTLNLTDPDSLSVDQRGNIVLDNQADAELVFVSYPFTDDQTVGALNITPPLRRVRQYRAARIFRTASLSPLLWCFWGAPFSGSVCLAGGRERPSRIRTVGPSRKRTIFRG